MVVSSRRRRHGRRGQDRRRMSTPRLPPSSKLAGRCSLSGYARSAMSTSSPRATSGYSGSASALPLDKPAGSAGPGLPHHRCPRHPYVVATWAHQRCRWRLALIAPPPPAKLEVESETASRRGGVAHVAVELVNGFWAVRRSDLNSSILVGAGNKNHSRPTTTNTTHHRDHRPQSPFPCFYHHTKPSKQPVQAPTNPSDQPSDQSRTMTDQPTKQPSTNPTHLVPSQVHWSGVQIHVHHGRSLVCGSSATCRPTKSSTGASRISTIDAGITGMNALAVKPKTCGHNPDTHDDDDNGDKEGRTLATSKAAPYSPVERIQRQEHGHRRQQRHPARHQRHFGHRRGNDHRILSRLSNRNSGRRLVEQAAFRQRPR